MQHFPSLKPHGRKTEPPDNVKIEKAKDSQAKKDVVDTRQFQANATEQMKTHPQALGARSLTVSLLQLKLC